MPQVFNGNQLHTELATRAFFMRDATNGVNFPWVEFGSLTIPATAAVTVTRNELRLPELCNALAYESVVNPSEIWTAKTANFGMANQANYFLADPAETVVQIVGASTAVVHANVVAPGFLQVAKADGTPAEALASIDRVTDGIGDLVEGTDYRIADLDLGMIEILTGPGTNSYTVDYTTRDQEILVTNPLTASNIQGRARILMQSPCGEHKWVRDSRMSVAPAAINASATQASDMDFTLTVLSDTTNSSSPAGTFSKVAGAAI